MEKGKRVRWLTDNAGSARTNRHNSVGESKGLRDTEFEKRGVVKIENGGFWER